MKGGSTEMKLSDVMKKGMVFVMLFMFIGTEVCHATTMNHPTSMQPTNQGSTLYVGGSGPGNYSTIQEAIDSASKGDTVYVYNRLSPYHENLVIEKSIAITGEKEEMPVIEGCGLGDVVTISGDASSTKMTYFIVQHSDTSGIFIGFNLSDVTISNLILQDCQFGVHCWHATTITVSNNIIRDNGWGIVFEFTDHSQVSYNLIENNTQYGIVIDSSPANKVYSNEIRDNTVGLVPVRSLQNEIYHNNFIDNLHTQVTWKNSRSRWHENYWSDSRQHLLKRIYFIPGVFRSETLNRQLLWIQLDINTAATPWTIPYAGGG
jgi:parallel beta-helix repeat protein